MISKWKNWLTLVLFAVASISAFAEKPFKVKYVFTPDISNPAAPILHVRLEFRGNRAGLSTLVIPTMWAGQRNLSQAVTNLKALDATTNLSAPSSDGISTLRYSPNHRVELAYDLSNAWTGALRHPKEFNVVLRPTNFIFNGQNGLVYPKISQTAEVQALLEWRELPQGWIVASSFGTAKTKLHFHGPWHGVCDALFAAGDFRTTHLDSSGEKLILAARGSWTFSDRQAAEEIMSLIRVERRFWGETKHEKFLVVLTSYDQDLGSSDGTVFTNSFLLYLSKKQTFSTDIKSQLAHEVFHTWNPYRMGRTSGEATEWFTEGFTEYYQDRILLEAGLINFSEYIDRLNRIVSEYWLSPDRNWPQQRWLDRKHTGNPEYKLPYKRGAIIALWLDETIRKESHNQRSLDDRMFALLRTKDGQLTTDSLISILSDGLSTQVQEQLRSFVENGVTIPMPVQLEPACATLVTGGSQPSYKLTGAQGCEQQLMSRDSR